MSRETFICCCASRFTTMQIFVETLFGCHWQITLDVEVDTIEKVKAFIENTRYCPRPEAIYLYWQGKLLEDGYTLARGP